MVATLGAGSGQTSRTGQGAWSTMKRLAGPRLRGPEVGAVAVAGEDEQVGAFGGGHDFPFDAAGALDAGAGASQALGCGGEELLGGGGGQVLQPGAGVALGTCRGRAARRRRRGRRRGRRMPVTCSSTMSASSGAWARAASTQAGQVPSTIQAMTTVTVISLR